MERVEIPKAPGMLWLGLALSLLMFAGSAWLIVTTIAWPVGVLGVTLFGYNAKRLIFELLDPQPRVVLSEAGILDRENGFELIHWRDIEGVGIYEFKSIDYVFLTLRNEEEYLARLSLPRRLLVSINKLLGQPKILINMAGLKFETHALVELIQKYVRGQDK
jgi:hypothetical protein